MAASVTTAKPFPGPVMVTKEPPMCATRIPPITAEISPAIAGAPEASASAMEMGKATSETTNPALRSDCQLSLNPLNPLVGLCIDQRFSGMYDQ
ncbi:MAG: Uncharacterised protein [Cryomorphaceae bacterium]|nr:MAG: Uncharacterised protein [Cryomorphaceae bacterium]